GVSLRTGEPIQSVEHRRTQLMQRSERELHLRLCADGMCDPQVRGRLDRVLEQGGLPYPRLAEKDEHPASPGPPTRKQTINHPALAAPTQQHHQPPQCKRPATYKAILDPKPPGQTTGVPASRAPPARVGVGCRGDPSTRGARDGGSSESAAHFRPEIGPL